MAMAYVTQRFFSRDTVTVARDLIGAILVVGDCEGRIVETEAYSTDAASHAMTRRKQAAIMGETFGYVYVYLIYGMYYCLNFTTEREGIGAVLIRAVEPTKGIDLMIERSKTKDLRKLASGPGRMCRAFAVDIRFNGKPIGREIKVKERASSPFIQAGPRIGISKATDLDWRFFEQGSPFVSR